MEQLLIAFGIDWRLLLINAINFGVLLGGLWYFLYKPITGMLVAREEKLAQGVRDADAAGVALAEIESTRAGALAEAGHEADSIIAQAREAGAHKGKEILSQAEAAAARAIAEAETQSEELKKKAIQESREEVAKMIVLGMEKLAKQTK